MENIGLALQLMVVGMVTVFIILMIVIQLGKWLIQIVNKVAPEETVAPKRKPAPGTTTAMPRHWPSSGRLSAKSPEAREA